MNDKTKTKAYYEKGKLVKLERATQGSPHTRTREEKQKEMVKKFNKAATTGGITGAALAAANKAFKKAVKDFKKKKD